MRASILAISLLVVGGFFCATQVEAADIIWASEITDPAGNDAPFITLLQGAGHNVTRFNVPATALSAAELLQLNAADLVIAARAINSGDFQDARAQPWNTQVTTPLIVTSAYSTRRSRLGWQTAEAVPDSGPTELIAVNPLHPVFAGISFLPDGVTMANDYNIMVDRGTTTIGDAIVGGTVIARNPSVAGTGIAIAEWPAGAIVTSNQGNFTLAGPRFFFAGGSREAATPGGVTNAGKMDLTTDGERLFLNTVSYALTIPEPSTLVLTALGLLLVLVWRKR